MACRDASRDDAEPPSSGLNVSLTVADALDHTELPELNSIVMWISHTLQALPTYDDSVQYEVSVSVVDESSIQSLNRDYRDKNKPTNVLSFPSGMPVLTDPDSGEKHHALGDVVVCHSIIVAEASIQGKAIEHHWAHMVVHSVLHLCGHDHSEQEQAQVMEALEVKLLHTLSIPNPYQQSFQI